MVFAGLESRDTAGLESCATGADVPKNKITNGNRHW